MNNKDYITLYSTFAKLCYFQHNMAYPDTRSPYGEYRSFEHQYRALPTDQ